MHWADKKVIVTGAGGFIGSHLVEKLVKLGADVRAFVRYNSRNDQGLGEVLPADIQSEVTVLVGDLRDSDSVNNVVKGADIVLHLGASISIPYSYVSPNNFDPGLFARWAAG